MNPRLLAATIAAGRVAFGTALAIAPARAARIWIGSASDVPGARVAMRATGARDIALGMGLLMALRHGKPIRGWVEAGAVVDSADVAFTLMSFRHLPTPGRVLTVASAAAVAALSIRIAGEVDRPRDGA